METSKPKLNWVSFFNKYKMKKGISIESPRKTASGLTTFFIYSDTFDNTHDVREYLEKFNVDIYINKINYRDMQIIIA